VPIDIMGHQKVLELVTGFKVQQAPKL
jgi:hypothetical protein